MEVISPPVGNSLHLCFYTVDVDRNFFETGGGGKSVFKNARVRVD